MADMSCPSERDSAHIYALKDRLVFDYGVAVKLFAFDLDTGIAGRCHYDRSLIEINEPRARHALLTLAHEGGHWLSYRRDPRLESRRSPLERELRAYLYGWALLCRHLPGVVGRAEWRWFHAETLEAPDDHP